MEKVQVSELASKLVSGTADAFRTSVCVAEPNSGKMGIMFATNLDKPCFGPWKVVKDLGFFFCNASWPAMAGEGAWIQAELNSESIHALICSPEKFHLLNFCRSHSQVKGHLWWWGRSQDTVLSLLVLNWSDGGSELWSRVHTIQLLQVVRASRWPLNQGGHWGSAALETETSCVVLWKWLSVLLSCNWASAYLRVSVSPWVFRKERCNSSAQSCSWLCSAGCFPHWAVLPGPSDGAPTHSLQPGAPFLAALCILAVMALCLLILKCPYNGPGLLWKKFPVFVPHSTGVSASTGFLTALRMPSTGILPAPKYPGTVWAAVLSDPFKSWEWLFWCLISVNMKGSFPSDCALGRAVPVSPNQKCNQRSHFL